MSEPIKIGDRVARIARDHYDGTLGTVVELGERKGRAYWADGGAPRLSIRVQWDHTSAPGETGARTWLALNGEGTRWRRA